PLTLDQIREGLDRAFPGVFLPPNEQSFVVEDNKPGGPRMIKSLAPGAQGIFLLYHERAAAFELSQDIEDPELRRLARSEHAWLSINWMNVITSEADAMRFIAKALAELAPPDAAFLETAGDVLAFGKQARRLLAEGNDPFSFVE